MTTFDTYLHTRSSAIDYSPMYSKSSYSYAPGAFTLLYHELYYHKYNNAKLSNPNPIPRTISTKHTNGKWILANQIRHS
jgi:hypothetical protein